jgi:hypothetical protein
LHEVTVHVTYVFDDRSTIGALLVQLSGCEELYKVLENPWAIPFQEPVAEALAV